MIQAVAPYDARWPVGERRRLAFAVALTLLLHTLVFALIAGLTVKERAEQAPVVLLGRLVASAARPVAAPSAAMPQAAPRPAAPSARPEVRPFPAAVAPAVSQPSVAAGPTAPATASTVERPGAGSPAAAHGEPAEAAEPPRYQAAYLNNPQPPYPLMSRRLRETGTVRLHVMVDAAGRAEQVRLRAGSGFDRLDQAAVAAVRDWRFVPASRNGQAVAGWVEVPVHFRLEN